MVGTRNRSHARALISFDNSAMSIGVVIFWKRLGTARTAASTACGTAAATCTSFR